MGPGSTGCGSPTMTTSCASARLRYGVDVVEWLLDPSGQRPDVESVVAELAVVRRREV